MGKKKKKDEDNEVEESPAVEAVPDVPDDGTREVEAKSNGKIRFDSRLPREEALAYFEALVAGLKTGKMAFRQGEEALTLHPADEIEVSVRAQSKGEKAKVSFEMSWRGGANRKLSILP